MSKVDWSLAPDDATHFGQGEDCGYWAKSIGNQQYFINIARWDNGKWKEVSERYEEAFLTARPSKKWSGPEDGLPPVGTICELRTKRGGWGEAEIKYQGRLGICVWLWVRRDGNSEQVEWAESPDKLEFRAIRTPEQIAAGKRETSIRELMDIAQVDCRVTAARLVDAGFKLPSKSGEDREQGISDLRDHIAHANFRRSPNSGDEELAKQLYGAGFRRERTPDNPFR